VSILDSGGNTVASAATDITGFNYFPTTGALAMNASYTIEVTCLAGFTSSTPLPSSRCKGVRCLSIFL
jgi:hypothetical protein